MPDLPDDLRIQPLRPVYARQRDGNIDEPFDVVLRPTSVSGALPQGPFALYDASDGVDLRYGVRLGLANYVVPTLGGAPLNDDPAPTAVITSTRSVWLKCVGTFGAPDTYVFTVEDTAGAPPAAEDITGTGFTSCILLGTVTVTGGAITAIQQFVNATLGVESYGNVNNWWAIA